MWRGITAGVQIFRLKKAVQDLEISLVHNIRSETIISFVLTSVRVKMLLFFKNNIENYACFHLYSNWYANFFYTGLFSI